MSARHDLNFVLETDSKAGMGYALSAVLFGFSGFILALRGYAAGYAVLFVPTALCIVLLYRKIRNNSTLLLSPGGFTFKSSDRTFSYRWADVDRFWVAGGLLGRTVCFALSPAAERQLSRNAYRLASSQALATTTSLPDNYGMGQSTLCEMLNEWRVRYSDSRAPIYARR